MTAQLAEPTGIREEQDLEPFLVRNLQSAPIKRASKQMQRSQGPSTTGAFLAWLQDGMQPEQRAALRSEIPPPVLFVFTRLFGRSYSKRVASVWAS